MKKNGLGGVTILTLTVAWVITLVTYEAKTPRFPGTRGDARASRGGRDSGFPFDDFGPRGPQRDPFFGPGDFGGRGGGGGGSPSPPRIASGGPGVMLATQFTQFADTDMDGKLTAAEFAALADAWFDKLDTDHTEKLSQQTFADRLNDLLSASPPPTSRAGSAPLPWGGGGAGRAVARGLFGAGDANNDSSLTRDELKSSFAKWSIDWDHDKNGSLDESELQTGLKAVLPKP